MRNKGDIISHLRKRGFVKSCMKQNCNRHQIHTRMLIVPSDLQNHLQSYFSIRMVYHKTSIVRQNILFQFAKKSFNLQDKCIKRLIANLQMLKS